jgi:hypothetical protein
LPFFILGEGMAQRRMFSKSITNSSRFLMMPQSSQNLYFHLGMNADDDGFCEHFTIMRMTESKPDDLKILQAKQFLQVFDDKVLIIIDWKENNYLRSDRYTPSKYLEIYKEELLQIPNGIPSDIPVVCLGKDRIGKDRIGKDKIQKALSIFGSLKNVFLSDIEYNSLIKDYGIDIIVSYIENLSLYIPNKKPPAYKDHNAVIRSWLNKKNICKKNDAFDPNMEVIV